MKRDTKIYGQHACRALFEKRPEDIVRVVLTEQALPLYRDLLGYCAKERKPYRTVPSEELEKVAGARHHEGICIVAWPKESKSLDEVLAAPGSGLILALDQVSNPHNIGTLMRSAAHFGARAVLVGGKLTKLSSAAYRTSEGAAEVVDVIFCESVESLLPQCSAAGFSICASSSHKGTELYQTKLSERTVILLGAEGTGLSPSTVKQADQVLCIPGSGEVESLNVASCAAVFLAEYWRQHRV